METRAQDRTRRQICLGRRAQTRNPLGQILRTRLVRTDMSAFMGVFSRYAHVGSMIDPRGFLGAVSEGETIASDACPLR